MVRYSYEKWSRYALSWVAFCAALLLTPRALLEVPEHADSHEIPVHLLENSLECLWCTPPEAGSLDFVECDALGQDDIFWHQPDRIEADDPANCRDLSPDEDPSA